MRLRSGKITKKEVRKPTRRYVRRKLSPRNNNNGKQSSNNIGVGMIVTSSTEPIASIASMPTIPSTKVMPSTTTIPSIAQEGVVFLPSITQSHPMTPRPTMATDFKPFATSFTMPILGRE